LHQIQTCFEVHRRVAVVAVCREMECDFPDLLMLWAVVFTWATMRMRRRCRA
jgi:hypothetical protein